MRSEEEDALLEKLDQEFKHYLSNPENVDCAASSLVDDLLDDAIISVVFDEDIRRKSVLPSLADGEDNFSAFEMSTDPCSDILGNSINDNNIDISCPSCKRTVCSLRLAPHLATCMGMGRKSSRVARNRIANNATKDAGGSSSCAVSDNDDDADWTVGPTEKKGKKKKEKSSAKKIKPAKIAKNGNSSSEKSQASVVRYENMRERDRMVLFTQICGVMSDHTKKVCTKSPKCPQHTDEQKKAVRDQYLSEGFDSCMDNLQIDVDTCEDDTEAGASNAGRSWEAENSNTSSPADSASTSSSSSKKRDSKGSSKSKTKEG